MFTSAAVLLLSQIELLPDLRVGLNLRFDNAWLVDLKQKIFPVLVYSGEGLAACDAGLRSDKSDVRVAA